MPVIKGGIWKNTEDEILKAAVSKYGLNQWARISSLLVRKTPRQCKARWFEWLNPSIKKTEWTREEDEKLLHLAKIMPTQWRTIAPIVGRTATQCLERYQRLLDDAEQTEGGASSLGYTGPGSEALDAEASSGGDRMRFGGADPTPESLPAQPDAIDMEEEEKEQLSEARARLANTQGKKAKRKARERQLEESRRMSLLQKRRELKAAGINIRMGKRKKGQMDYNAEIPFEKQPAPGFYDTAEETERNENMAAQLDYRKFESRKRSKEQEDEAWIKRQKQNDAKRNESKTESITDQILKHRMNRPRQDEDDAFAKPRSFTLPKSAFADEEESKEGNEMTPYAQRSGMTPARGKMTPGSGVAMSTPRDTYALNTPVVPSATPQTPVEQREYEAERRQALRAIFNAMPKPKNDYELMEPADVENQGKVSATVTDASERDAREREHKAREEELALQRRSQVLQRGLPRPVKLNVAELEGQLLKESDDAVASMVVRELVSLLVSDATRFPTPETQITGKSKMVKDVPNAMLENVHRMVKAEAKTDPEYQAQFDASWMRFHSNSALPGLELYDSEEGRVAALQRAVDALEAMLSKQVTEGTALEKSLSKAMGGYEARETLLAKKLSAAHGTLLQTANDHAAYALLEQNEAATIPLREESLAHELERVRRRERDLQEQYRMGMLEKIHLIDTLRTAEIRCPRTGLTVMGSDM